MIDVSEFQGAIDWRTVYEKGGVRHAYIKLLEHVEDTCAERNLLHARAAGVTVGVYFYAHPSEPPHRAAARFLAAADKQLRAGDLPPALDLEIAEGLDYAHLNDWKAQWFAVVDEHVGTKATFYSYYYFWRQMRLYPDRPVWGAAVGASFKPPASWSIHQYSFSGEVAGVPFAKVDLSKILKDVPAIP